MPELFNVGRGNPTEEMILQVIDHMKDGWNVNDLAERIGRTVQRVSRWLTELAKVGQVVMCRRGKYARWCSPENKESTEQYLLSIMSATYRKRLQDKRLYRKVRVAPKPRPKKEPPKLVAGFVIPPRGVPCSVWQLGQM